MIHQIDWLSGDRRFPGEVRLPNAACLVRVQAGKRRGKQHAETRYYISSATLDAAHAAQAVRGHWAIENRLHWVLEVTFREVLSRLRKGYGTQNTAVVRHFALNFVRADGDKKSIKLRGKRATWAADYLNRILSPPGQ